MRSLHKNILEGARNWAAANKSDPFSYATAISEALSGVSSLVNETGQVAFYNAEPAIEMRRTPEGEDYPVTIYRNLVRP